MRIKPSVQLVIGFLQWIGTGIGLIAGYLLTLDGFSEWDWFYVTTGALFHLAGGVGGLVLHLKNKLTGTIDPPAQQQETPSRTPEETLELFNQKDYGDMIDVGNLQ